MAIQRKIDLSWHTVTTAVEIEMMLIFANILLQIEDAAKVQGEAQKAEAPVEEPAKESYVGIYK